MALLVTSPRVGRSLVPLLIGSAFVFLLIHSFSAEPLLQGVPIIGGSDISSSKLKLPVIEYKPVPTFTPPPIADPFPLLAETTELPPPIPRYNVPRPDMHKEYGLEKPPPLFIGFTRQWPILLQAVVSYINAGWPADSIIVVENTGVHNSNRDGKLTLQNPFYLNHTTLARLGVHVVQTPVLLTFSQLQNFFLSLAHQHDFPCYFYSHQDVLVFSFEDGPDETERPGDQTWQFYDWQDEEATTNPAAAGEAGYRTIYENSLREIQLAQEKDPRWGFRWFQFDHLTLVNRAALDAVGGWDSMIPYYHSDCDTKAKILMDGWSIMHRRVGIINDVSSTMDDLLALFRDPSVYPHFSDPNPLPPDEEELIQLQAAIKDIAEPPEAKPPKMEGGKLVVKVAPDEAAISRASKHAKRSKHDIEMPSDPVEYFRILNRLAIEMGQHKYRDNDNARNTWQKSQRGGQGEPFYYDPDGFARAFELLTAAGRQVFREKWGHFDCDLVEGTALKLDDQWRVEKDYKEVVDTT